ncbi:hypothetical protein ACV3V0_13355, partial [Clostridium perfringens]
MNIELFKDLKYVGPDIVMQHYKPWHIIEIPKKLSNQNEFLYVLNVALELLGIKIPRFLGNTPNGV